MAGGKVITFGKQFDLVGAVSKPRKSETDEFELGVIIIGMGIAEVQIARRLTRFGWVVLQTRLIADNDVFNDTERQRAIYDQTGVARVQEVMDYMTERFGTQRFILMGTCGGANVCVNTALQDSRVVGLVPINAHFSELLTHGATIGKKLLSWQKWREFIAGKADYRRLKQFVMGKIRRYDEQAMASQYDWAKDMVLPLEFGDELEKLTRRGVNILMVYAHTEDSLTYLEKHFRPIINKLSDQGQFTLEVIERDTHVFSHDGLSADILNDIINRWFATQTAFA